MIEENSFFRKSSFAHFHRFDRDENLWFHIVGLIKAIKVSYQRTHSMWSSSKDPLPLTTAYPSKCVDFYEIFGGKVIIIKIIKFYGDFRQIFPDVRR